MKTKFQFLFLLLLFVEVFFAKAQTINEILTLKVFINLDSCLSSNLKQKMILVDERSFVNNPFSSKNISFRECDPFHKCFDVIDSLFINDSTFKKHIGNLLNDFQRPLREIIYKAYYQHLTNHPLTFEGDLDSLKEIKRQYDSMMIFRETADTIKGYYIPIDLEDALEHIPDIINPLAIDKYKNIKDEDFAVDQQFNGMGMTFRNIWWLGNSRLSSFFQKHGIRNLWDESVIILRSWHRQLNHKPIDFDAQVKECLLKYKEEKSE